MTDLYISYLGLDQKSHCYKGLKQKIFVKYKNSLCLIDFKKIMLNSTKCGCDDEDFDWFLYYIKVNFRHRITMENVFQIRQGEKFSEIVSQGRIFRQKLSILTFKRHQKLKNRCSLDDPEYPEDTDICKFNGNFKF